MNESRQIYKPVSCKVQNNLQLFTKIHLTSKSGRVAFAVIISLLTVASHRHFVGYMMLSQNK